MTETKHLKMKTENCDVIIGDLNLNPQKEDQKNMLSMLCGDNRVLSLNEPTTFNQQSQLDHIIIDNNIQDISFSTSYLNFASDHNSIVFRMGSQYTREFKQRITFDKDSHLKKKMLNEKCASSNTPHCKLQNGENLFF